MSLSLPNEVTAFIIDELWAGKDKRTVCTLSLVAKCFTAPCQERLWRTVTLISPGTSYQSRISLMQVKTIQFSPHIGGYVRTLDLKLQLISVADCLLAAEEKAHLDCCGRALKLLPNLDEISLASEGPTDGSHPSRITGPFREAVIQIVTNGGVRSLTLIKICEIPLEVLSDSLAHLDYLELHGYVGIGSSGIHVSQGTAVALTTLKCDSDSYRTLDCLVDPPQCSSLANTAWDFSRLRSLELSVDTFIGDLHHAVLRQATSLQYFHLEIHDRKASSPDHRWRSDRHKDHTLKALNSTLTQLKLSLYHDAYDDLITNPLMSTIADGFPKYDALQSFEVDIYLNCRCRRLNWRTAIRDAGSGNDTWAKLDNALSGIISLKEVRMRFHIEFFDKGWLVVTREAAEGVREHIMETVYPSHFRGLCARRDKAEVQFEYVVNLIAL